MPTEITGKLEQWWYDPTNHVFWGFIKEDVKKRFKDDSFIHTSNIRNSRKACADMKEGDVVHTLNSHYLLSGPSAIEIWAEKGMEFKGY